MTLDATLTPRQVATALRFTTPRPIYRLIRSGELPAAKVGGRLLIDAADVEALVEQARPQPRRPTGGLRELERRPVERRPELPSSANDKAAPRR